jgi:hypothetical protein
MSSSQSFMAISAARPLAAILPVSAMPNPMVIGGSAAWPTPIPANNAQATAMTRRRFDTDMLVPPLPAMCLAVRQETLSPARKPRQADRLPSGPDTRQSVLPNKPGRRQMPSTT